MHQTLATAMSLKASPLSGNLPERALIPLMTSHQSSSEDLFQRGEYVLVCEGFTASTMDLTHPANSNPDRHARLYKVYIATSVVSNSIWNIQTCREKFEAYIQILLYYVKESWGLNKRS